MNLFLLPLSSMRSFLFLLSGSDMFFFVVEKRKNNDSFGFTESLRSFIPRKIRKFIKCVPAEYYREEESVCPSSLFMKPLRVTGKETSD